MILDAYNKEVDSSYKFDQIVPPTQGYLFGRNGARYNNEGAPPFYAESTNMGRRRGLFASRDMRKGEVVHDGTDSDVTFPDAMAYRRFVFALPRKTACDITEWTWTQRLEQDGPMKIMLAINISAMLSPSFSSEEANVLPESSTSQLYYATRDIKRGEEILTDSTFRDQRDFAATDLVGMKSERCHHICSVLPIRLNRKWPRDLDLPSHLLDCGALSGSISMDAIDADEEYDESNGKWHRHCIAPSLSHYIFVRLTYKFDFQ
eukprot:scaffold4420_cov135-Skeletonema_dohrnii-CCMP3373.AAC.6